MKRLKDDAKDQGNMMNYGNYTMQEIILGKVASGLQQYGSVQPENCGQHSERRKADYESGSVPDDHL